MKKLFTGIFFTSFLAALVFLISPRDVFAGSFYLAPGSKTVGQGTTFGVAVRLNTGGEQVNAVQANFSYPAETLDYLSVNPAGSAFGIDASSFGGSGSVQISRGSINPVSGDILVATIYFRAKPSSGTANISIAGGTAAVRASDQGNVASGGAGGTYTFTVAPPKAAAAPSQAVPPVIKDTAPPKITNVKVIQTILKSVTITWDTDEPANSIIEYGLSQKYISLSEDDVQTQTHRINLSSDFIVPGSVYHYRVKSTDAAGNTGISNDTQFTAKGYTVEILIHNLQGQPVKKIKVTLSTPNVSLLTDAQGLAVFDDVPGGKQLVEVGSASTTNTNITVVEATSPNPPENIMTQRFTITVKSGFLPYAVSGGIIVLIILGIFLIKKIPRKPRMQSAPEPSGPSTLSTPPTPTGMTLH